MQLALQITLVVTSVLVVLLVLLHRAKGGGLSTLFGGGVQSSLSGSTIVEKNLDRLTLFGMGYSWGGFESLVVPFKPHRTATRWQPEGYSLRLHIGLESPDDLKADLAEGFTALNSAS